MGLRKIRKMIVPVNQRAEWEPPDDSLAISPAKSLKCLVQQSTKNICPVKRGENGKGHRKDLYLQHEELSRKTRKNLIFYL